MLQEKHIERNDSNLLAVEKSQKAAIESIREVIEGHRNEHLQAALSRDAKVQRVQTEINRFEMWRSSQVQPHFDKLEEFIETFTKARTETNEALWKLEQAKAEKTTCQELRVYIQKCLREYDQKLDKQRDDQLTLEHYTERYVPIQTQNMIVENMKVIHNEKTMALLLHEENKVNTRMEQQLLDMTNLAAGTIFDNMLNINKELTRKLKLKIDLRTQSALGPGAELDLSKYDKADAMEEKLQRYIDQFIDLNELHSEELEHAQQKL